jgi:hypothetical protein
LEQVSTGNFPNYSAINFFYSWGLGHDAAKERSLWISDQPAEITEPVTPAHCTTRQDSTPNTNGSSISIDSKKVTATKPIYIHARKTGIWEVRGVN